MTVALPPTLIALAKAAAEQRDPAAVFRAAEAASAALIGHRLFTALFVVADGTEVERIYSSDPAAYPLTGRKQMGPTPWGEHVLKQAVDWISEADCLIVGGTSLVVYPAAGLINYFNGHDLILINKSETSYDDRATLVINDSIGKVLGD